MQKSLAKNGIFYLTYEVLNVLFPFLTGMYVAHVLLPESIGQVAYAQNIAQYFVIFSFLGIPTYGMREVAKAGKDRNILNRLYSELMVINGVSTFIFLSIYVVLIFAVPRFRESMALFLVVGLSIALNFLNNSWLYTGLEEFPYISVRNLIFKIFAFGLLVLFVRDVDHYIRYAAITVVGTAGNYIMNIAHAHKFVSLHLKKLNFRPHMRPILYLVAVNLAIEIYTLVDTTMLGMLCDDKNVAFYSYGSKIIKILLQVVNSFTMVLVPRISSYYKEKKQDEFNMLLTKVFKLIVLLALPMMIGIQFTGNFLVVAIYGKAYIHSAYVLRILSSILLVSPIGYLLGSRVLLAADKESEMVFCVGAGAIVNVICNAIMIPRYQEYGAAVASIIGELVVMIIYVHHGRKIFKLEKTGDSIVKIMVAACLMSGYLFVCTFIDINRWAFVWLQISGAIIVYSVMLILLREPLVTELMGRFFRRVKK